MRLFNLSFLAVAFALSQLASAANPGMPAPTMPKSFEMMKNLKGTWEGTSMMGGKETPTSVTYEVTANGTAVKETLMPGTPHEMVTMYYAEGNDVNMTHFCAVGNHPKMTMKKSDATTMEFELAKGNNGLKSTKEPHMHSLTITMTDTDHMKHEWIMFENGKKKDTTAFTLTRKK